MLGDAGRDLSQPTIDGRDSIFLHGKISIIPGHCMTKFLIFRTATFRARTHKANYASVRGPYKYANNNFPIQNFYLQEAVKDADGNYTLKTAATILKDVQDRFHDKCPMK